MHISTFLQIFSSYPRGYKSWGIQELDVWILETCFTARTFSMPWPKASSLQEKRARIRCGVPKLRKQVSACARCHAEARCAAAMVSGTDAGPCNGDDY